MTLADRLLAFTVARLEALVAAHLPDLRIPGVFGGHRVGPDVRADLAFTIGLLGAAGVGSVAGRPVEDALEAVLQPVDGAATNTFFSYRVAETLLRFPTLLDRLRDSSEVLEACDSTSALPAMRDGSLPRNYGAVLLRCEAARSRLGLDVDPAVVDELVERTVAMLAANPGGYLDDSHTGIGRYDIYSADVYLFTEPVASRLGDVWSHGARVALDLVARVGATNGAGITWGRSIGALATCLTIELTGLAAGLRIDDGWSARGANAFDHLAPWFGADGLITAHQHRSTFGYRGPFRRLQMTLDCLGKLADTAVALQRAGAVEPAGGDPFPARDEVVAFESARPAGVWTYRSRDLAFVLPLVGSTVGDYLPAPRNPGLFEVPVDTDLPTAVPSLFVGSKRYTSGGVPAAVEHSGPGELVVSYDGFPRSRQFEATEDVLAGRRVVRYRVEGRTLHADEELSFVGGGPEALAVQLSETTGRPLRVTWRSDAPHATTTIDTSGMKEHRSFWAELPLAHQRDVDVDEVDAPSVVRLGWSVTPKLRVLSTERGHHYTRAVFDPLVARGDVVDAPASRSRLPGETVDLGAWDLFHLHWPEWYLGPDVARHRAAVERLQAAGVRIVWTQHNLVPHDKDPRHGEIYAVWAAAADGVVHHSEYGRRRAEERYRYRADAIHAVIPHPSFGELEAAPGEGPIRLGIVGAPRGEKDVQAVLDAFAATTRPDLELHVWSLRGDEVVPDDPRIHAEAYGQVDRSVYDDRLRSLDALVLPFAEGDMITTGTVGDVVAAGIAALVSGWGYLAESLGPAGIPYGDDLTAALEGLSREQLWAASEASVGLRPAMASERVAELHLALFEAVGTTRL